MKRRVFKWHTLVPDGSNYVGRYPHGKVLLVAPQDPGDKLPTLWIEHDEEDLQAERERDLYVVIGTGQYIPEDLEHVGSCICANGTFVWHIYKVVE